MDRPAYYEIQVDEWVDECWSKWFEGLDVVKGEFGGTILRGEIADRAALFGILGKLRDLGLTLVSLQRMPDTSPASGLPKEPSGRDTATNPNESNNEGR